MEHSGASRPLASFGLRDRSLPFPRLSSSLSCNFSEKTCHSFVLSLPLVTQLLIPLSGRHALGPRLPHRLPIGRSPPRRGCYRSSVEKPFYLPASFSLRVLTMSSSTSRLFTDRYALSPGTGSSNCNPGDQTWCGGTWNSIRENLDYIQKAGFTASELLPSRPLSQLR